MTLSTSSSHNSFIIWKDLTGYYQDGSLWDRIAGRNGYDEFEGIYPGCYFDLENKIHAIGGGGTSLGSNKIVVIGCNSHFNMGDNVSVPDSGVSDVTYNHIVCCPQTHFGNSKMNEKVNDLPTTVGGYKKSKMSLEIIGDIATSGDLSGTINQQLYYHFGSHLKTVRETLTTAINDTYDNPTHSELGASSSQGMYKVQSVLMSEAELFGTNVYSSAGIDTACARTQYPAFRLSEKFVNIKLHYWLKNVATAKKFASCHNDGYASASSAHVVLFVRPRFILA